MAMPSWRSCQLSFELQYTLPQDLREETGGNDLCWAEDDYEALFQSLLGGAGFER